MNDIVIRAEGLGKRYLIGHRAQGADGAQGAHGAHGERYTALRDVIARNARGLARSAADLARGRPLVAGDTVEELWALRHVSFEVRRGEVVGIVGRNGAGKSTLLKILSRITEPSEGRVTVRGRVASLLEVGTGFHPELTGRENIYLNGAILGMTRAEIRARFDAIVAFAEVERFLDTPVKRYSSGMHVRLAFAVAAHLEPEILIVDEVLAVGDAEFQRKCLGKMGEVAEGGRTVLLVSHNMGAVRRLCPRSIYLRTGTISIDGATNDVIERYSLNGDISHSVSFRSDASKPTITSVNIDQEALAERNLILDISFDSPRPLRPICGIVVYAASGEPVWGSNGRFHARAGLDEPIATGCLRCESQDLPLVPGAYSLSVWLGDWQEDYDVRENVLRFLIGRGEGSPFRPSSANGHVDWPARWRTFGRSRKEAPLPKSVHA